MTELINGKTPEEIKTALELCNMVTNRKNVCESCPYNGECTPANRPDQPGWDALLYIQHLEAERDALLKEVHGDCDKCKHYDTAAYIEPCYSCRKVGGREGFEWRGPEPPKEEAE